MIEADMVVICTRFTPRQAKFLDNLALKAGTTRSAILREIVENTVMISKPVLGAKIELEKFHEHRLEI